MDNLTHTLTGAAISYCGFNRKTRYATLALVLGANLPDADIVSAIGGPLSYLQHHREISHSIAVGAVEAVLLAAVVYYFGRRATPPTKGPPLSFRWLTAGCCAALASHLLLDWSNYHGVQLLWPLSTHWYALDLDCVVDPLIWIILGGGLGLGLLFHLINEEVGSTRRRIDLRRAAFLSLAVLAALFILRSFAHQRALAVVDSYEYQGEVPKQLGAFPRPIDPFTWDCVAETGPAYYAETVYLLGGNFNPSNAHVFRKPESSPALKIALETGTAKAFMNYARFPFARVEPAEHGGYVVTARDLREHGGYEIRIELDQKLNVTSQAFSFSGHFGKAVSSSQ